MQSLALFCLAAATVEQAQKTASGGVGDVFHRSVPHMGIFVPYAEINTPFVIFVT